MKLFLTFVLLSAVSVGCMLQSCSNQTAVQIVCSKIENIDWSYIGAHLTCSGDESMNSTFSGSLVSSVLQSNKLNVSNLPEITALKIHDATVKLIPFGIKKHFPNLKALEFDNCGLLSVYKENLKEFRNSLEYLSLYGNKLNSIDADLFEYSSNLKAIYLGGNPFVHIKPEFFTNLKNLKSIEVINLRSANCIDEFFSILLGDDIMSFEWDNEKCTDFAEKVEKQNMVMFTDSCLY